MTRGEFIAKSALAPPGEGGVVATHTALTLEQYYHYDALGNVVAHTNSSGDLVTNTDFVMESFGNVLSGSESGLHLTSKEYFDDIDIYYFNARWYDPVLGLFISKSPFGADIEHPYSYAKQNPAKYVDSNGLTPAHLIGGLFSCAGGAYFGLIEGIIKNSDNTNVIKCKVLAYCALLTGSYGQAFIPKPPPVTAGIVVLTPAMKVALQKQCEKQCKPTWDIGPPIPMPCMDIRDMDDKLDCCKKFCKNEHDGGWFGRANKEGMMKCQGTCMKSWMTRIRPGRLGHGIVGK